VVGRTGFPFTTFDADWVKTFVSPDCSFDAVADELDGARSALSLAAYQFESLPLAEKLANASRRGVDVIVLLEGFPVGGITDQQRACTRLIADSGARVRYLSPGASVSNDRYQYLHSKYCVVDGLDSIIISENWKTSGLPPDPSYGNRGWGVVVRSRGMAGYLQEVFDEDSDELMRDIYPYSNSSGLFGPPPPLFLPDDSVPAGAFSPMARPALFQGRMRVSPVLSPDTSSLPGASVLGLMGSARSTLCIEQLSIDMDWDGRGEAMEDLFLEAAVEAARRGVEVKVLLDGTYMDPTESGEDNMAVLNYLEYTAALEGLPLKVRIASIPGTLKLHNKGVIADGRSVLVSSLNWVRSSVFENREVGVIIEGSGPAAYFTEVFMRDWNASGANDTRPGAPAQGPGGISQTARLVLCFPPLVVAVTVLVVHRGMVRRTGLRRPSPASAGREGPGKGPEP
jgi:phosphatidylserine/phosphatidylglycerophosphate/cardiolipin synthase-like enzyme